jgi:hypothetical protein
MAFSKVNLFQETMLTLEYVDYSTRKHQSYLRQFPDGLSSTLLKDNAESAVFHFVFSTEPHLFEQISFSSHRHQRPTTIVVPLEHVKIKLRLSLLNSIFEHNVHSHAISDHRVALRLD